MSYTHRERSYSVSARSDSNPQHQNGPAASRPYKPRNGRAHANRQWLPRVLDAKNKELSAAKADLERLRDENRELHAIVHAEISKAGMEMERHNVEFREVLHARDIFCAAKMAQERKEFNDRERVLRQLLNHQMKEREEMSHSYEALRASRVSMHEHLATIDSVRRRLTNDHEAKFQELTTQLEDFREKLERAECIVAEHRAVVVSKEKVIAQLHSELAAIAGQHQPLRFSVDSNSPQAVTDDTEMASILEVSVHC
ncbi:hypothetical protein V5O48_016485 [Marasmius crinis-equi]|uniref:SWI5-dependent HO expression protein 3 n=1 Tax=Marasmius crinis-equi TaxID=585013 RepID=A0ABR3ERM2_9AGAR